MDPQNEPGMVRPWLLIVFLIVILAAAGFFVWQFRMNQNPQSTVTSNVSATPIATPTKTATPTPTVSVSSASGTYQNSTYGFNLTFPDDWAGYKMKEADISGATAVYYINIPTKDTSLLADSTADKGYYSPFAISVYTLAQWEALDSKSGPKDTLIAKNSKYAFAWIQSNGVMPSDFKGQSDIKTIIESFKLD